MSSARIAVVDDNTDTLALMNEVCREQNWEMVPFQDGKTALEGLKEAAPDVIVLDLWLERPDSGWIILQQLKDSPGTRHIPVVMCTGNQESLRQHEVLLGKDVAAFLSKPFDLDDVVRCFEYALSLSKGIESHW